MLDERLRVLTEVDVRGEIDDATVSRVVRRGRRVRASRLLGRTIALLVLAGVAGALVGVRHRALDFSVPVTSGSGFAPATCGGFDTAIEIHTAALSSHGSVVAFAALPMNPKSPGEYLIVVCAKGRPKIQTARVNPTCVLSDGKVVTDSPSQAGGGMCFGPDQPTVTVTPDGRTVYFNATGPLVPGPRNSGSNVYSMDVASGEVTRVEDPLKVPGVDDFAPRVSADGITLSFIRRSVHWPRPGESGEIDLVVQQDIRTRRFTSARLDPYMSDQLLGTNLAALSNPNHHRFSLNVSTTNLDIVAFAKDPKGVAAGTVVFRDQETGLKWSFPIPRQPSGTTRIDVTAAISPEGRSVLLLLSRSRFLPFPDGRLVAPPSVDEGSAATKVTDPNTGRSYLVGQEETTSVLYLADPSSKTIRSIQTPKGYDGIGKYSLGLVASGDGSVLAVEAPIHSSLPRRSGADLFLIDVNSGRMHRVTWYPHWWIMHERPLVWTLIILISLWAASAWGALAAGVGRDDAKRFNLMILILGTGILAWIALLHGWPGWPLLAFGISAAVTEVFAPHPRHFLYRRKRNSWQPIGM